MSYSPHRSLSPHKSLARIALFAAFIAVLGLLPKIDLPIAAGVPLTAQTLGVMLAGLVLGARNGALAVTLFLGVVALGMPLLAGGRGGLGVFLGPSAGFLFGWIAGAAATGWLAGTTSQGAGFWRAFCAAFLGGIVVVYGFGIPWLAWSAGLGLGKAALASAVFIPGDILKAILAAFIARQLPHNRT